MTNSRLQYSRVRDLLVLTWVSDAAVVVHMKAGSVTPISIVLRRAGDVTVTATFSDDVDGETPVNLPSTVATRASASPSTVIGTSTVLAVLGADDGGEANLTYTWASVGTSPATISFSANGTNGAKTATATFTPAGSYTFQVTIKDQGNLSVASSVSVTVNPTLTNVVVTPAAG
jgi:hypothetical protein